MKDKIEKLLETLKRDRYSFAHQSTQASLPHTVGMLGGKVNAYTNVICELQGILKATPEQFGFTVFSKRKAMAVGIELMQDGEAVQIQEFGDDAFSVTMWGSFARIQDILLRHFDEEDVKNILS
jgi:hypothetical protein